MKRALCLTVVVFGLLAASQALLALAAVSAFAAETIYQAPTGAVHPVPGLPATMYFTGGGSALAYPGGSFHYVSYTLPDGTTANLTNLTGSYTEIASQPYLTYHFIGTASGVDSTGASVSVSVTWKYRVIYRRGNYDEYLTGSMEVSK